MKELLLYRKNDQQPGLLIPVFYGIHAGFESPAADYEEERIDLNDYVSKYPDATFYGRVVGDCMNGSGIFPDDLLVVDRSLDPLPGDVVVGILNNEFILRWYFEQAGKAYLLPDNPSYQPIEINEEIQFRIWGVVPHTVLNQRKRLNVRINRFQQLLRKR